MTELKRERYLSQIRPFYADYGMIKVLTGMRRCGKSTIMRQIRDEITASGVDSSNILMMDLDDPVFVWIKTSEELDKPELDSYLTHGPLDPLECLPQHRLLDRRCRG